MSKNDPAFMRATMRHFSVLAQTEMAADKTAPPFPDDWFDISADKYADFGAMYYLMSHNKFNSHRSLTQITAQLEPALRLGQYRIFRSGGYPRAFITWAGLNMAAERRLAVDLQGLSPQQWNSGSSTWLMDFVAPFGQLEQMLPMLSQNQNIQQLRTLWHNRSGARQRVVEWYRDSPKGEIKVVSYGAGQFAKKLRGG